MTNLTLSDEEQQGPADDVVLVDADTKVKWSLKEWWNREIILRIKYVTLVAACAVTLVLAFQVQTSRAASIRQRDQDKNRTEQCEARVESRADLREILFFVVDLSDLIDSEGARLYTLNRTTFINHNYPALSNERCSVDGLPLPIVPNTTEVP